MATGDLECGTPGDQCLECGSLFPFCPGALGGQCTGGVMMRPKPELAFQKISIPMQVGSREIGQHLSPEEMRKTLAGYMGDDFFAEKFMECIDMIKVKNADYSQGEQKGDRIAAFRRISRDINITMEQAWAVFCQKHWGAVMKYIKQGTVESEPIEGRISDIINYMILLSAIIADGKKEKAK